MQDLSGQPFLKIQGSAPWLSRLVCNCSSRKSALANGNKISELKKMRNGKLLAAKGDGSNITDRKAKAEQLVEIEVGNTLVSILCHGKRSLSGDLLVMLKEDQLSAIFDFLQPDCHSDGGGKRSYQKSGGFVKKVDKNG